MRCAVIDIGTNTILMLIADIHSDGSISVITDEHFIARLGKGVDEHGNISQDTFARTLKILSQLKIIANSYNVEKLKAFGTSALRTAKNSTEFIQFIKNRLSIDIQIISAKEEAELSYMGAISDFIDESENNKFAVLDIGGGSTELVKGNETKIIEYASIDIGSVRLTERILKKSPPDMEAINETTILVQKHIEPLNSLSRDIKLIGVAGTLTTLAAIDLNLIEFDKTKVNHHLLTLNKIIEIYDQLKLYTIEQIMNYPSIHPLRADIILAGIIILKEIMKKVEKREIIVSDRGLRYGLLLEYFKNLQTN